MHCPTLSELPLPPPGKTGWPWTEGTPAASEQMSNPGPWPKISIVTPSYNQGRFLEETIRSVLLQGYQNLEYIVIDGGSTDNSVDLIRKYEPWLAYWVSEKDGGQADAINKGFVKATGDLLGFINSDDHYSAVAFSEISKAYSQEQSPASAIICGAVQDFCNDSEGVRHANSRFGDLDQWLDGGISLHQPGCFWTRLLWSGCGPLPAQCHYIFDRYFFARCRINNAKFISLPQVIAWFRLHEDSKTFQSLIDHDLFSSEWDLVKSTLELELDIYQSYRLRVLRQLSENWRLISAMMAEPENSNMRDAFWRRVIDYPYCLFHRPMAAAIWRLMWNRISKWAS